MQPGEKLILSLSLLHQKLLASGVERTAGLLEAMGNDCSFYRKSLDIFIKQDFDEIETLLKAANAEFSKLKGSPNE